MQSIQQKAIAQRLQWSIIAFFVLAALSIIVVYIGAPSTFTDVLMLSPSAPGGFNLAATLFLVAILLFISFVIVGVTRHWRWLFWLLLLAFGFSVLEVPATILQFAGVIPVLFPTWYTLYRTGVAIIEFIIAIWMLRVSLRHGVWGMGKKY